jgi:inhibitor of KinA
MVRVLPAGDGAVLAVLGDEQSLEMSLRVQALARAVEAARVPGVSETVPSYCTLLVHYDPVLLSHQALASLLADLAARPLDSAPIEPRLRELPTVYGGSYGPDLPEASRLLDLREEEVVRLHSGATYTVCLLGFAPGQPYVVGLPPQLALPRRHSPRERVPAGAVTIANQTNAYPMPNPTGWWWIGRTCVRLFDPAAEPPTYLRPGDQMRFIPISEEEYLRLGGEKPD